MRFLKYYIIGILKLVFNFITWLIPAWFISLFVILWFINIVSAHSGHNNNDYMIGSNNMMMNGNMMNHGDYQCPIMGKNFNPIMMYKGIILNVKNLENGNMDKYR